jgi:tetratricopeptide (TPR) repeat protein
LRRAPRLARQIKVNPHDRRARAELGEILGEQGRWARAVEVLRPAAQEDPHDLPVLYSLGLACLRLKRHEEGELFLRGVHGADPEFRLGRAPLEIGKHRLRRGGGRGRNTKPLCPTSAASKGVGPGARGLRGRSCTRQSFARC